MYCHAESVQLDNPAGPGASYVKLTDGTPVTLDDLNRNAPTRIRLRGDPLVFVNACESARMSPTFYNGFVPYFMAKGARGVIGTECSIPSIFATEWAIRFFDEFLKGITLGEVVLHLRQAFLRDYRNPLGMLYTIHCDADTLIAPPIAASRPDQ